MSKTFDPGKNGLHLTHDSVTRLRNDFATNDPNVIFSYIPFQDNDTDRPVEMCSLEVFLLQNVNANDKVIIIADMQHTQKWSEREVDPVLHKGDLAFLCFLSSDTRKFASLGTRAHPWYPTKRGRLGNIRICGRSRSDR